CVQSPKCGNGNNPLDKEAALQIAEALLESDLGGEPASHGTVILPPREASAAPPRAASSPIPLRLMGRGDEHEPLPTPVRRGSSGLGPAGELTLILDVETQKSAEE